MWWALALVSAVLLGVYDVAKKQSLKKNSVMWVLFSVTALSTLILSPFFSLGESGDILRLIPKAALVSMSWISGLEAMKRLPLTIASTLKASRPVFVVILSILIFGERLAPMQWVGVVVALGALFMLSRSSAREGIHFRSDAGIMWMLASIVCGVSSALYDKHLMRSMDPVFVLCWSNLFSTVFMGAVLGIKVVAGRKKERVAGAEVGATEGTGANDKAEEAVAGSAKAEVGVGAAKVSDRKFTPDWYLLLTAVLIVCADALYFKALACDGAMLSVISLLRRGCVIITFTLSALIFKEHNIRSKAIDLAVLLCGMTILALAS